MSEATTSTVTLSVPDISCDHCARTITGAITPLAGVHEVAVDVPDKTVRVRHDAGQEIASKIGDILAEEGYPVASTNVEQSASA